MSSFTQGHRFVALVAGAAIFGASVLTASPAAAAPGPMITGSLTYAVPDQGGPPDWFWVSGMEPGEPFHATVDYEDDGVPDWQIDGTALPTGTHGYDLGTVGHLVPGSRITVTATGAGTWSRELVLDEVRVEHANDVTDVVAGIAPASAAVRVSISPPGEGPVITRDAVAGGDGWWRYDFATDGFDLLAGQLASVELADGDGDITTNGTDVQVPVVHATVGGGPSAYVLLNGWADGTPVAVGVDYDADGTTDDTFHVIGHQFGPGIAIPAGQGPLQIGSVVTAMAERGTDPDRWTKVLTVEPVTVDSIDPASETATGTAPPGRTLQVEASFFGPPEAILVDVVAGGDGTWTADFTGHADLRSGTTVTALLLEVDGDGDTTNAARQLLGPPVGLDASPTAGLWDQAPMHVSVSNMPPNAMGNLSLNVASDPYNQYLWLPGVPTDDSGWGQTMVTVPRFVGAFDCASAPGACLLVASDPNDPFLRNASIPLSFGRLDLFRYTPDDPADPGGTGTIGAPIGGPDEVSHGEWIWVQGTGFQPGSGYDLGQCKDLGGYQVCRTTWPTMRWVLADGDGTFGVALQVGRNVFAVWGNGLQLSVAPTWDVRDGQTLTVSATGLPPDPGTSDCGPGACWIGVRQPWTDDRANIRSVPLTFTGGPVPVTVTLGQALEQQMEAMVHIGPTFGTNRDVSWDQATGTLSYGFTAVQRWVEPDPISGPYSPPPPEAGRYDCADVLAYDASTGAREPVHCALVLVVTEHEPSGSSVAAATWTPLQFARLDLTAEITSAALSTKPAGVTLRGEVTCTGFSPEQYLVNVEGALSQTSGGKRPSTLVRAFAVTTPCSGTMANPGTAFWSVFLPGSFKAGSAEATIDVSAAAFTRTDDPLHVEATVTITGPSKGGRR